MKVWAEKRRHPNVPQFKILLNKSGIDLAWYYIKAMSLIGAVSRYKDFKKQFYEQYHNPYLERKTNIREIDRSSSRRMA